MHVMYVVHVLENVLPKAPHSRTGNLLRDGASNVLLSAEFLAPLVNFRGSLLSRLIGDRGGEPLSAVSGKVAPFISIGPSSARSLFPASRLGSLLSSRSHFLSIDDMPLEIGLLLVIR